MHDPARPESPPHPGRRPGDRRLPRRPPEAAATLPGALLPGVAAALVLAGASCAPDGAPPPPETRTVDVVDTIHGTPVPDPYRWLEDGSAPEVRRWLEEQNAYAERVIGESPLRDSLRARFRALHDRDDVGSTRDAGEWEYFTLRREGEERARIVRRPDPEAEDPEEPDPDGEYEVVVDPLAIDSTGRTSAGIVDFTGDGSLMLYSIRVGGADERSIRVLDTETLEELPDSLPNALYGGVEFDADDEGFHYTHRDRIEGPRIRHHVLGTDPSEDELVWGEGYGPTTFIGMEEVADGRYRIFTAQHGWARSEVWLQDREGGGEIRPVAKGLPAHFDTRWHEGRLWMRTDLEAPNYRLVAVDPDAPARERWEEVIPEGESLLRDFAFIDGRIFVTYLVDVADRIRIYEPDGTPAGEVEVPPRRSARIEDGEEEGTVRLSVEGYLRPEITREVDPATGERRVVDTAEVAFDTAGTVVERVWHTSADGTRVPMYVMRRSDVPLDGTAPTILSGYGGFDVSITPGFSRTRALWVELGGIWAVTTLRGGSEFGEGWHRDGMLENKTNVFDDFISAADWLVENGYTSPERLASRGASNGGLLVATAMTRRPDLFGAVVCTYPDLDMIRFPRYERTNNKPALLEYGDARIPEHFDFLIEYSPYQAVEEGTDYPAVYLATGDLDTRVPPAQARKMAARLQAATASGEPVLLVNDEKGGHAAGRGRTVSLRVEAAARQFAFIMQELGMTGWAGTGTEAAALPGVAPRSAAAQVPDGRDEGILRDALVQGIAMGLPGISAAIGVGDRVVWAGTAGYADLSRRVPVREADRFGVGSITKTFVARVILQLVEEGKLDLERTPADYLDLEIVGRIPNADRATPHFREVAGVHRAFPLVRPRLVETTAANLSPEWTAGGLVSSARDLVR